MNFNSIQLPFSANFVDLLFILIILYFVITNNGLITSSFEIIGLFFSFIISFKLYPYAAYILTHNFSLTKGFANAGGFIITWLLAETIFFLLVRLLSKKIPPHIYQHKWNYYLGFITGLMYGIIFYTFIVTLIIALPVRGNLKKAVLDSRTAPFFVSYSSRFESNFRSIFNDAIAESLNFLTVRQNSDEKIELGFTISSKDLKVDKSAEQEMLKLVNHERTSRGLKALTFDESIADVSREYGKEMFTNGFFAHQSQVDNSSPAERLDRNNIPYIIMGENLAYAPTTSIAHTGLMNSPGHRANILSEEFGKIGIGVIDGGIYGKMYVQEFTN